MTTSERRTTSRVSFKAPCQIDKDSGRIDASTVNVSLGGALLVTPNHGLDHGDSIELRTAEGATTHVIQARVAHVSGDRVGLSFRQLTPEALGYLRNVVQYNSGADVDPHQELSGYLQGQG